VRAKSASVSLLELVSGFLALGLDRGDPVVVGPRWGGCEWPWSEELPPTMWRCSRTLGRWRYVGDVRVQGAGELLVSAFEHGHAAGELVHVSG
jgi:hypothetical protein